jgi:hypothetical protein
VAFRDILAFLPQDAPSFDVEDTAGLIGYPILQTFDVWFDYRSGNMFLAPNAAARKYLKPIE